jgi:fructose-bisphosphate aldolase class II
MDDFSSIMFDASKLPFEDNIKLTSEFVKKNRHRILIEGACDEITDASGNEKSDLTTAEKAEEYFTRTGVDLIVANLGTEHRASAMELKYYDENARSIKDKVGNRIVLHGASSVLPEKIGNLFKDGVCKVNIWAALERDSSPALFRDMVINAAKVAGGRAVKQLKDEGLLGEKCHTEGKASLSCFTTLYRQNIIFSAMVKICSGYYDLWYK